MFSTYIKKFYAVVYVITGLIYSHGNVLASEITPSHVFQVTQDILKQLERMHVANLTKPMLDQLKLDVPPRFPRHAFMQSINVLERIQVLKIVNGLVPTKVKSVPVKEVNSADVMEKVQMILSELTNFDKVYGLSPFEASAHFEEGKTSTEVFQNLLKAQEIVTQLGIPIIVPNDIFENAISVTNELQNIRKTVGDVKEISRPSPSSGKHISDTYAMAYFGLKGLQTLSKKPNFEIPNGVIVPKRLSANITTNDAQQILLFFLAELSAMKVVVGATEELTPPSPVAGQTPSTTYDQLGFIVRLLQSM